MATNRFVKHVHRARRIMFPSAAEKRFYDVMGWAFMMRYGVQREYPLMGFYVDYAIPKYRLGFEIDGYNYHHRTIDQWKYDKWRDGILGRAGWTIVRIPARDLWQKPDKVKQLVMWHVRGH